MTERVPYDAELGNITDQDREYAADLISDFLETEGDEIHETVAQWLRNVRYEAVMADRARRAVGETSRPELNPEPLSQEHAERIAAKLPGIKTK